MTNNLRGFWNPENDTSKHKTIKFKPKPISKNQQRSLRKRARRALGLPTYATLETIIKLIKEETGEKIVADEYLAIRVFLREYKSLEPEKQITRKAIDPDFYKSRQWRELRYKALRKYGRRCMCCGASPSNGVVLHVDHIKPRSKYPELELKLSNLQVLCEDCNIGKSNKHEDDFTINI